MRVSLTSLRCYALLLLALLPTVLLQAAAPVIGTTSFNSNFGATQTLAGPLANTVTATNVGGSGWDFTSVSTSTNMVISVAAGGNNPGGASDWCIRMPTNNGAISLQSAAVKSNDNSHFNLQTVYLRLNMPPASSSDITLTGYRGGVVVSGATLTKTGNLTNNTLWIKFDVSANSAFNDVDQFIFTQAASSSAIITSMFVDDITIAAPINLPLTLLDFSGQRTDNKVNLQWTTAREENTAGFEVQRADNGADFSTIGMVQAAGNSTQTLHYNYTEALPAISSPAYFYRLKMSDLDGRSTYSPVLKISVPSSGLSFSAYPNPFREQLAITMEAPEADKAQLTIRDMNGQQLLRQDLSIQKGANSFPLPAMVRLPAGLYLLNIATSHQQQTIRVLKIE